MIDRDLVGKTALVTGASSGLGAAFARLLAARGARVLLAARRIDRLEQLANELRERHQIEAIAIPADLAAPGGAAELCRTIGDVDILVNNAGAGIHTAFTEIPWERFAAQLRLNIEALTELTHHHAQRMKRRGLGYILNVASIGAFLPVPGYATYAAGKAYVRQFTDALAYELRGSGVRISCISPGGIDTEFFDVAGQPVSWLVRTSLMAPERCARIGLAQLFRGRSGVPGLLNKLMMFAVRFVPRQWLLAISERVMGGTPRARS